MKVRDEGQRVVAWFSCGDCSAVAAKLALGKYGPERVVIAYTETGSEAEDNERFLADCEGWFGKSVTRLRSAKYATVDEVIEGERFLRGPHGAPCTRILKKEVRQKFERPDDIQVFGYASDLRDVKRWKSFTEYNTDLMLEAPLIEGGLMKSDCHAIVSRAGIDLPIRYKQGFPNNNCKGCVKAESPGYWNRTRQFDPEVFATRARQERMLGYALVRINKAPVFLDELDPGLTDDDGKFDFDCSLFCHMAEQDIHPAPPKGEGGAG